MSNEKPAELTEAERQAIRSVPTEMALHSADEFHAEIDSIVRAIVKAREAAARREALLEARGEVQRRMDDAELADGGKLQTWDALASVIEWIEEKA